MPTKLTKKYLSFNDVFIAPQYSTVLSRETIDTTTKLGPLTLKLPVISANMPSITGVDMCIEMAKNGGLGILPRFDTIENAVEAFKDYYVKHLQISCFDCPVGVSIGVQSSDKERFEALFKAGARLFCVDVAHGHHLLVKEMLQWIRDKYGSNGRTFWWNGIEGNNFEWNGCDDIAPIVIAGNVASVQAVSNLVDWGADIIKCGVGPGACCQTRSKTGVGVPQFGLLEDLDEYFDIPLISDGGIKHTGDVSKALIFSNAVMVAKMIAGTKETPGCVYEDDGGNLYKKFGGSASGENKVAHGGKNRFVEGHMTNVPFRGKVKYILNNIREGLQSAMSYSGASNMAEYKEKVIYGEMSSGGVSESKLN